MEKRRREGFLDCCKQIAVGKYGVDPHVVRAWTVEAFETDYEKGVTPSDAVEQRIREMDAVWRK